MMYTKKPYSVLLLAALAAITACTTPAPKQEGQQTARADGSSIEHAVVIHENDTQRGIAAENRWIRENLPGCRKTGQALRQANGGIYDQIQVRCADGQSRSVYFDIRHFFGRIDGRLLDQSMP